MNKTLPDKWIRKAVSDAIDGVIVSTIAIPCYDLRITRDVNSDIPKHYIIMSSQSNEVDKQSKCEWVWESSILLDIVTRYDRAGDTGSRVLADDILDAVRDLTKSLTLDAGSGLEIVTTTQSFPSDLYSSSGDENIIRKFLRLELLIK